MKVLLPVFFSDGLAMQSWSLCWYSVQSLEAFMNQVKTVCRAVWAAFRSFFLLTLLQVHFRDFANSGPKPVVLHPLKK
jgi:hypothetical protein